MSAASDALVAGVLAVAEALRAACNDPADAIRLLSQLAAPVPAPAATPAQAATAALCRQAALVSLARACAACQLSSADQALAVRAGVAALFDAEIEAVADAGQGALYLQLRALRTAVITDLNARGALLPQLRTVTSAVPMPSLAVAYALYGDATRADDLAARSGAAHPGFLPLSFQALSA